MNKVKKVFVLVLIATVILLGMMGCNDKQEHPSGEHPSKETEQGEHPSEEKSTEHPTEHPAGEHPK